MSDNGDFKDGSDDSFLGLSSGVSCPLDDEFRVESIEKLFESFEAMGKISPLDAASREFKYNEMTSLLAEMQRLCVSSAHETNS
jgi:hypothetical protein